MFLGTPRNTYLVHILYQDMYQGKKSHFGELSKHLGRVLDVKIHTHTHTHTQTHTHTHTYIYIYIYIYISYEYSRRTHRSGASWAPSTPCSVLAATTLCALGPSWPPPLPRSSRQHFLKVHYILTLFSLLKYTRALTFENVCQRCCLMVEAGSESSLQSIAAGTPGLEGGSAATLGKYY